MDFTNPICKTLMGFHFVKKKILHMKKNKSVQYQLQPFVEIYIYLLLVEWIEWNYFVHYDVSCLTRIPSVSCHIVHDKAVMIITIYMIVQGTLLNYIFGLFFQSSSQKDRDRGGWRADLTGQKIHIYSYQIWGKPFMYVSLQLHFQY